MLMSAESRTSETHTRQETLLISPEKPKCLRGKNVKKEATSGQRERECTEKRTIIEYNR